ncbi:MAG TPA: argininosuccinate lyase [Acidimicrobiia bacterium]
MPTLWSGRFGGDESNDLLRALGDSLEYDRRLYVEDIAGSRAHVRMLAGSDLITTEEMAAILQALDRVESEIEAGTFEFDSNDEDIHTSVERRVTELTPAGAKIHTGRSRNDQVAVDMRLFTRSAIDGITDLVHLLQGALLRAADRSDSAVVPAYTHLQRAQPVTLGHYFLSHGWALQRDVERLADARHRANVSPLGAGAIAGTSLPIDVEVTAAELGFDRIFENSIDAVGDRDFVAESLFCLALLGVHLSRIGEDIVLWSSSEFGYLTLDDRFSTGSSMMPQKKNPDVAELVRGKTGRLIGNLTGLLVALKGLPSGYNKDLQEDKEALFDSVDTISRIIPALAGTIDTATLNVDRMRDAALDPLLSATDLAEWLVKKGVPFRDAHGIVGALVQQSVSGDGDFVDLVRSSPDLGADAANIIGSMLRDSHGSGSPVNLDTQIERFRRTIGER